MLTERPEGGLIAPLLNQQKTGSEKSQGARASCCPQYTMYAGFGKAMANSALLGISSPQQCTFARDLNRMQRICSATCAD